MKSENLMMRMNFLSVSQKAVVARFVSCTFGEYSSPRTTAVVAVRFTLNLASEFMRFFSLLSPLVFCSSPVDPCADLCNFDGPSICTGGSWTKRDNSCHAYLFRGDPSVGDYCYHTASTSSACPSPGDPVRPDDVFRLMRSDLAHLLADLTTADELCGSLDELQGFIYMAVRDFAHMAADDFWFLMNGALLLQAAGRPSACQTGLLMNLVTLVTETPHALDDPQTFAREIGFTRFCRDNIDLLRRLIITYHGNWHVLPRFVPFVFGTVTLRRQAVVELIHAHQSEPGMLARLRDQDFPGEWCSSLGNLFVPRGMTGYYELDADFPLDSDSRAAFMTVGECIGQSLLLEIPIQLPLPRWFFNKLLNNRVTLSDLEMDDSDMYRMLRRAERGGRHVVRALLGLEADDPVPDVSDYVDAQLASLTPPETEARFEAIREGLNQIVPISSLKTIARTDDIQTLVVGDPGISVDDIIDHSLLSEALVNSPVIEWLWDWLRQAPLGTRRDFLRFVTGNLRLPLDGMAGLPRIISISVSTDRSVRADIDRYSLEIPIFSSPNEIASALLHAVTLTDANDY